MRVKNRSKEPLITLLRAKKKVQEEMKNNLISVKGTIEEKFTVMEGRIDVIENKFEEFEKRVSGASKEIAAVVKELDRTRRGGTKLWPSRDAKVSSY